MSQEDDELDEITAALEESFDDRMDELDLRETNGGATIIFVMRRRLGVVEINVSPGAKFSVPVDEFRKIRELCEMCCYLCGEGVLKFFVETRNKPMLLLQCDSCSMKYRLIDGEFSALTH